MDQQAVAALKLWSSVRLEGGLIVATGLGAAPFHYPRCGGTAREAQNLFGGGMMHIRSRWAASIVILVVVVSSALTACHKDPYTGTWKDAKTGIVEFKIEKHGQGWTVIDTLGRAFPAKEVGGELVVGLYGHEVLKPEGDRLVLIDNGLKWMVLAKTNATFSPSPSP